MIAFTSRKLAFYKVKNKLKSKEDIKTLCKFFGETRKMPFGEKKKAPLTTVVHTLEWESTENFSCDEHQSLSSA